MLNKQNKKSNTFLLYSIKSEDTSALGVTELKSKSSRRFGMRKRLISSLLRFIQGLELIIYDKHKVEK